MKIAHIYDEHYAVSPEKGSVAKAIYNLATTQSELGHDVTVIERQWSGRSQVEMQGGVCFTRIPLSIGSEIEGKEIPYKEIKSFTGIIKLILDRFEFALKLRRYLKTTDYDIVHVHVPFAANILIHVYPEVRKKLVYTAHVGEEDVRFGLTKDSIASYLISILSPDLHLMRRAEASTVLNEKLAKKLPLDDLEVLPNGVDIAEYSPGNDDLIDLESECNIADPFVLFVGTITPRKGPAVLLDAVSILEQRDAVGNFSFVFAGNQEVDAEYASELTQRAKEYNSDIHFPGFLSLEELKAMYAACDIFVLPSFEEGWGMVITEAMAAESPIIASNVSGIPQQVTDGQNGILVEPGNEKELADAIQTLIEDDTKRREMGQESRELTVEKFSWQSVSKQFLSVYASILNQTQP